MTMLELQNFWNEETGPVMIPADKVASYEKVHRPVFLGENFLGPFYADHAALEITLTHGAKVYAPDIPENRIILDINRLD